MIEIGYRFGELYWAGQDRNWDYAKYQADKVRLALELALERRPKRAASAQPFLKEDLPDLVAAIEAKDGARYQVALERVRTACARCHVAGPSRSSPRNTRSAASRSSARPSSREHDRAHRRRSPASRPPADRRHGHRPRRHHWRRDLRRDRRRGAGRRAGLRDRPAHRGDRPHLHRCKDWRLHRRMRQLARRSHPLPSHQVHCNPNGFTTAH